MDPSTGVNAAGTLTYLRSGYVRVKAAGASGLNLTYVRLGVGYRRPEPKGHFILHITGCVSMPSFASFFKEA